MFPIGCCGGPLTPLATLKSRIVSNITNPQGLILGDRELDLFPLLMADDFCLESVVSVNAKRICEAFPNAIGKWIRSNIDPDVRGLLAENIIKPSDDPFLNGIETMGDDQSGAERIILPERYSNLDLGDFNINQKEY